MKPDEISLKNGNRYLFANSWFVDIIESVYVFQYRDQLRAGLPEYIEISEEDYHLATQERLNEEYMFEKYALPIVRLIEQKSMKERKNKNIH